MKKILKFFVNLILLCLVILIVVIFAIDSPVPVSWVKDRFQDGDTTLKIKDISDIENSAYRSYTCLTRSSSYTDGKKSIEKEEQVKMEKKKEKNDKITFIITTTTTSYSSSGKTTKEDTYTLIREGENYSSLSNDGKEESLSQGVWETLVYASYYTVTPLNILTGEFSDYSNILSNAEEYSNKGLKITLHSTIDNVDYTLSRQVFSHQLVGFSKATKTYKNNVLSSLDEKIYTFKAPIKLK